MADDSLLDDLSSAVDEGLKNPALRWNAGLPIALPYVTTVGVIRRSKHLLNSAKDSIADDTTKHLDYESFVRFLADTPVPTVPKFEREPVSLGSGWTMSVYRGRANLHDSSRLVAVK